MLIQSHTQIKSLRNNKYQILLNILYFNSVCQLIEIKRKLKVNIITSVLKFNYFTSTIILKNFFKIESSIDDEVLKITDKRILIVCNHYTKFDPYIILSELPYSLYKQLLPIRFFTANMYFRPKVASFFLKIQGCFRAKSVPNKTSGLKSGLNLSDQGHTLLMFPQGKRVKNSSEQEFVTIGPGYLTKYRNFTILPVYIEFGNKVPNEKRKVIARWGKPFKVKKEKLNDELHDISKQIMNEVFKLNN